MAYIGTSPTNITNVADNLIDEANLKVSNTPINGYFLSAQSGNTGGLTWAAVPAGYADSDVDAHLLTSGVTLDATNDRVGIGTATPASTLHLDGGTNTILTIDKDDAGLGQVVFQNEGTLKFASWLNSDEDFIHYGTTGVNQIFYTGGSERFRFGTSGQLGIGGANYGSSGQYLKSNGSGSAPSWASVSSGYGYYDSPTFYNLTIQGSGTFNSSVTFNSTVTVWGSFNNYSDDRLKVKSNNIPEALSKISKLNGFYYTDSDAVTDIKKGKDKEGNQLYQEKETTQKLGVSAQELEAVLPEVISKLDSSVSATNTEYLAVDYTKIVPLLIEGIKELKTKVETLETKVAALEAD